MALPTSRQHIDDAQPRPCCPLAGRGRRARPAPPGHRCRRERRLTTTAPTFSAAPIASPPPPGHSAGGKGGTLHLGSRRVPPRRNAPNGGVWTRTRLSRRAFEPQRKPAGTTGGEAVRGAASGERCRDCAGVRCTNYSWSSGGPAAFIRTPASAQAGVAANWWPTGRSAPQRSCKCSWRCCRRM